MPVNEYHFLTHWRVEGTIADVAEVLNDAPSLVRWWPSAYLDVKEEIKPIEQHGFTIADFLPDRISLRIFKWDVNSDSPDAIDNLQPFHSTELGRPI